MVSIDLIRKFYNKYIELDKKVDYSKVSSDKDQAKKDSSALRTLENELTKKVKIAKISTSKAKVILGRFVGVIRKTKTNPASLGVGIHIKGKKKAIWFYNVSQYNDFVEVLNQPSLKKLVTDTFKVNGEHNATSTVTELEDLEEIEF